MINLNKVPAPKVIESLDYRAILGELEAKMIELWPEWEGRGILADPIQRLLIAFSFRELYLRQRINDAAAAVMITKATGSDLDNLAAFFGVSRLLIKAANNQTVPRTPAVFETDDDLRVRIQLAPEAFNTAGCEGAYEFLALSAGAQPRSVQVERVDSETVVVTYKFNPDSVSAGVKDVSVVVSEPGHLLITVLSRIGNGLVSDELIAFVESAVSGDDVRPVADYVTVQGAQIVPFSVRAIGYAKQEPPSSEIERAIAQVQELCDRTHRLGKTVALSALLRELHLDGVFDRVRILEPAADLLCNEFQAPYLTGVEFQWVKE